MVDVFLQKCYSGTDHLDIHTSEIVETAAGNYTITAEGDIVIVDASEIVGPAFGMCGGRFAACLALFSSSSVLSVKKHLVVLYQQPDGTIYQPNQTTVQQYVPPAYSSQPQQTQPTQNRWCNLELLLTSHPKVQYLSTRPNLMDSHLNTRKKIEESWFVKKPNLWSWPALESAQSLESEPFEIQTDYGKIIGLRRSQLQKVGKRIPNWFGSTSNNCLRRCW